MGRTLPYVSVSRVFMLPRTNIVYAARDWQVRGAIEAAGLGERFIAVKDGSKRGTIVRVLHIEEDPAGVMVDLEGVARADVTNVDGRTAVIEELTEQPADPALLAAAKEALKGFGTGAPARILESLQSMTDGVAYSFLWAMFAGTSNDDQQRVLDLETDGRLRFAAEYAKRR